MSENFPMIRLELEASKLSLMRALDDRHEDITKMIAQSFDNAISHIGAQLDMQVHKALTRVMSEAVDRAADIAAEGLADELAESMASQVRELVAKRMRK